MVEQLSLPNMPQALQKQQPEDGQRKTAGSGSRHLPWHHPENCKKDGYFRKVKPGFPATALPICGRWDDCAFKKDFSGVSHCTFFNQDLYGENAVQE